MKPCLYCGNTNGQHSPPCPFRATEPTDDAVQSARGIRGTVPHATRKGQRPSDGISQHREGAEGRKADQTSRSDRATHGGGRHAEERIPPEAQAEATTEAEAEPWVLTAYQAFLLERHRSGQGFPAHGQHAAEIDEWAIAFAQRAVRADREQWARVHDGIVEAVTRKPTEAK